MLKLKEAINKKVQIFINNQNKQQQKFLCCYTLFLIVLICKVYPNYDAIALAFFLILILVILFFALKMFFKTIQNSEYAFFFFGIAYLLFFVFLFFFKYFSLLIIYSLFVGFTFLKKTYLQRTKEKPTMITTILNDFEILDFHFQKEFWLFNQIRYFNFVLLFFICCSFRLFLQEQLPPTFLGDLQVFLNSLFVIFIIFIANSLLVAQVHLIITYYCNPHMSYKFLQACSACAATGAAGAVTYIGVHIASTSPFIDPPNFPGRAAYQQYKLGYVADREHDLFWGSAYSKTFLDCPPTTEDGHIDTPLAQARVLEAGKLAVHEHSSVARDGFFGINKPKVEIIEPKSIPKEESVKSGWFW